MQIEWVFFLSVYFSLFVGPFNLLCAGLGVLLKRLSVDLQKRRH